MDVKMDINDIVNVLPHRYPMLLVDRVLELKPKSHIVGYKNLTYNEEVFQGHFPQEAVFPGALVIEALAQLSALLGCHTLGINLQEGGDACYLGGVDGFKFRRPAIPGDQLMLHSEIKQYRSNIGYFDTRATVEDEVCCEGRIVCCYRRRS